MNKTTYLSLGSNLGDKKAHLKNAISSLETNGATIIKYSAVFYTEPIETTFNKYFFNIVCAVKTHLNPIDLLEICQAIELDFGRVRTEPKAPRPIDIDILFFGNKIIQTPLLKIPHPALRKRNFVLVPMEEIAPKFRDPVTGKTIRELLHQCSDIGKVERLGYL